MTPAERLAEIKGEWCDLRAVIVALIEAETDRKLGVTARGWTAADQVAFDHEEKEYRDVR